MIIDRKMKVYKIKLNNGGTMKTFLTKLASLLVVCLVFAIPINAQTITFTFANPQVSGGNYTFDIMVQASTDTHFKLAQVYINYNTAAFGSSIAGSVVLSKPTGSITSTITGPTGDVGSYNLSAANNTSSKLAIQNTWAKTDLGDGTGTAEQLTNILGTTPKIYARGSIPIQNAGQSSGLSFDPNVTDFDKQQFYITSGNNQAQYSTVNTGGGIDDPLPVELNSFNAKAKGGDVELVWQTKTEVNNYGFELERKSSAKSWEKVSFIKGNGNSNSPKEYSFVDKNLTDGSLYTYRLKQLDNDGKFSYSDEVEVEVVPSNYELFQNYPNPLTRLLILNSLCLKTAK